MKYAKLLAAQNFEPHEENPMIAGVALPLCGAASVKRCLECCGPQACAETWASAIVIPMIPFCRTRRKGWTRVLAEWPAMAQAGRERVCRCMSMSTAQQWIGAEAFSPAERFDGFSSLQRPHPTHPGLDRDSALVADLFFDERHPHRQATMIRMAIPQPDAAAARSASAAGPERLSRVCPLPGGARHRFDQS